MKDNPVYGNRIVSRRPWEIWKIRKYLWITKWKLSAPNERKDMEMRKTCLGNACNVFWETRATSECMADVFHIVIAIIRIHSQCTEARLLWLEQKCVNSKFAKNWYYFNKCFSSKSYSTRFSVWILGYQIVFTVHRFETASIGTEQKLIAYTGNLLMALAHDCVSNPLIVIHATTKDIFLHALRANMTDEFNKYSIEFKRI